MVLTGCGQRGTSPGRNELIQLLGELEPDVVILGGDLQEKASEVAEVNSPGQNAQEQITKLWVVRSINALPTPRPQGTNTVRKGMADDQFPADAFPARVLYDLAAAMRIRESELPWPAGREIETAQGRLIEWTKSPWTIRIRDFHADTGWLSVVEAFTEQ